MVYFLSKKKVVIRLPLYPKYQPVFSAEEVKTAQETSRKHTAPQSQAKRAQLVMLLADNPQRSSPSCADELNLHEQTVRKWRKRWTQEEFTLEDRPRSGRRWSFSPLQKVSIKAIACELPACHKLPFSRLSISDIATIAITEGIVDEISTSTVWRWLSEDAIRPWYQQTWVFVRDPQFLPKAETVLDLYHGFWQGEPLTDDDRVISADEKTIQALNRAQREGAKPRAIARYDYEYERHGTLSYLAALDVMTGEVIGTTSETNGIQPFMELVSDVMQQESYCQANRVFWLVDNGCAHHPSTFPARLADAYPNAIAVHLPKHASWLNQIEIYFSILTRKFLKPNDFESIDELTWKLLSFEAIYSEKATPFNWRFTKDDLKERFKEIDTTIYGITK